MENLRNPITDEMFDYLLNIQSTLSTIKQLDSLESVLVDWIIIGRHLGLRASEYSQSTQSTVDKHVIDTKGTTVTMAFTRADFTFEDLNKCTTTILNSNDTFDQIKFFTALFRVQKKQDEWTKGQMCIKQQSHQYVPCQGRHPTSSVLSSIRPRSRRPARRLQEYQRRNKMYHCQTNGNSLTKSCTYRP